MKLPFRVVQLRSVIFTNRLLQERVPCGVHPLGSRLCVLGRFGHHGSLPLGFDRGTAVAQIRGHDTSEAPAVKREHLVPAAVGAAVLAIGFAGVAHADLATGRDKLIAVTTRPRSQSSTR